MARWMMDRFTSNLDIRSSKNNEPGILYIDDAPVSHLIYSLLVFSYTYLPIELLQCQDPTSSLVWHLVGIGFSREPPKPQDC